MCMSQILMTQTSEFFEKLPFLDSRKLIFGGDLNCFINPVLDRSAARNLLSTDMSKSISEFMANWLCRSLAIL